ncbi:uncharacterized protein LAESUDRAFT_758411 [Laetiporus sulphureus 93-53]|uniref:Uncharacterized protein n=1 Tax=Laetiporus sulphureus 93-53 TaxID=1314785 RepID=A0A165EMZ1_9APHY|nr:uncharacterized protein LAESUDRAFT_758411 [Laetiporus sulphureus 93-53]KZT07399.1 hypothetical protein LAESUDRAFT_758411 [Laetiporus sulphureus 93-53]
MSSATSSRPLGSQQGEDYADDPLTRFITVHNFSTRHADPIDSQDALDRGKQIVDAAVSAEQWFRPARILDELTFIIRGNCYAYIHPPPRCFSRDWESRDVPICTLKDWGEMPETGEDPDVFSLQDLKEFESTRLLANLSGTRKREAESMHVSEIMESAEGDIIKDSLNGKKRAGDELTQEERPPKRPCFNEQSLQRTIPQPHYIPSPVLTTDAVAGEIDPSKFYASFQPTPIAPYTSDTMNEWLEDPAARGAWVVPIRGALPWEDCTPAAILFTKSANSNSSSADNEEQNQLPRRAGKSSDLAPFGPAQITWTYASLVEFWAFLRTLREAGTLGPISLSFHSAPVIRVTSSSSTVPQAGHATESKTSEKTTLLAISTLLSVDHIKIYHDVGYAMRLRNVLHAWRYKAPIPQSIACHRHKTPKGIPSVTANNDVGPLSSNSGQRNDDGAAARTSSSETPIVKVPVLKRAKLMFAPPSQPDVTFVAKSIFAHWPLAEPCLDVLRTGLVTAAL